jgi:hypothetical protein
MAEGSIDATLLIATSWQALKRVRADDERTELCNCSIVIVFAAFFIEANLNHIIRVLGKTRQMKRFLGGRHPGLQDKLGWFYNEYVARSKATTKKQLRKRGIGRKLGRKFLGFHRISRFRNRLAHGSIDATTANPRDAEILRVQAKVIVDQLFEIARNAGRPSPRSITYELAIASCPSRAGP